MKTLATRLREHWILVVLLILFVFWVAVFTFVSPDRVVEYIGVKNTYLVAFLLAVFGGLSTLTGTSFYAAVATFAAGGASKLLLSLIGGLGIFISDTIFFLLARRSLTLWEEKAASMTKWLHARLESIPGWAVPLGVFFYIGMTPLPNDVLMIALALAGYPYRKLAPVIFIGSISIVAWTVYLGDAYL